MADLLAEAYERALELEKAGDVCAAEAWRDVLALNEADPGGAAIRLAALGEGETPDVAPPAYVAALFDQHAEVFDLILVDQLEYGVPMLARERLQALQLGPFERFLDLGCGTGLAAEAFEDMADNMTGVDIAEGMVEIAAEKELYDRLFTAEAVRFLNSRSADGEWDLIAATDVLPYLGDAAPFFHAVARRAAYGGVFTFSTETLPAEAFSEDGWRVTPHHRFAHDPEYIAEVLADAGFDMLDQVDIVVRREQGAPIRGHLFTARKR
ncbi:MAG: methyltransferase domain-containing protein [Pseudomonadota bacterium]